MNYLCPNTIRCKVMDIETLSSLINELLIKEGEVVLPHIGKFYYKVKQASLSNDGNEMLPPSKQISFIPNAKGGISNMVFLYSERNDLSIQESEEAILSTIDEVLEIIKNGDVCTLPEIGKLLLRKGEISFEPEGSDENDPERYLENIKLGVDSNDNVCDFTKSFLEHCEKKKVVHKKNYKNVYITIACIILFLLLVYLFREPLKPILEQIFYTRKELDILREWGNQ